MLFSLQARFVPKRSEKQPRQFCIFLVFEFKIINEIIFWVKNSSYIVDSLFFLDEKHELEFNLVIKDTRREKQPQIKLQHLQKTWI